MLLPSPTAAAERAARPVPWIPPVLYAAVLAGGLYHAAVADRPTGGARTAGFAAAMALLLGLELLGRRSGTGGRSPAGRSSGTGRSAGLGRGAGPGRRGGFGGVAAPGPATGSTGVPDAGGSAGPGPGGAARAVTAGRRAAARALAVRLPLFAAAALLDGSGVSRALFVLVPFTARFAFGRLAALVTAAGCLGLMVAGFALWVPEWWRRAAYVSDLLMFALGLALAVSMAAVAVGEQQGRARLERALAELEQYAQRVAELSTTEERNRVARDIHDSVGHHLTAVAIQLEKAEAFRELDPRAADRAVSDARRSAGLALTEVRESVSALRDTRPFSLARALAELSRRPPDDRPSVTVRLSGDERGYGTATLTALHRTAQEAVTNARRHGLATTVRITADCGEFGARLVVADDGCGFADPDDPTGTAGPARATGRPDPVPAAGATGPTGPTGPTRPGGPTVSAGGGGHGIRGMHERIGLLGGRVELRNGSDGGAVVTVTVPRRSPAVAGTTTADTAAAPAPVAAR